MIAITISSTKGAVDPLQDAAMAVADSMLSPQQIKIVELLEVMVYNSTPCTWKQLLLNRATLPPPTNLSLFLYLTVL